MDALVIRYWYHIHFSFQSVTSAMAHIFQRFIPLSDPMFVFDDDFVPVSAIASGIPDEFELTPGGKKRSRRRSSSSTIIESVLAIEVLKQGSSNMTAPHDVLQLPLLLGQKASSMDPHSEANRPAKVSKLVRGDSASSSSSAISRISSPPLNQPLPLDVLQLPDIQIEDFLDEIDMKVSSQFVIAYLPQEERSRLKSLEAAYQAFMFEHMRNTGFHLELACEDSVMGLFDSEL